MTKNENMESTAAEQGLEQEMEQETAAQTEPADDTAGEEEITLTLAQFNEVKARIDTLQKEKDEAIDLAKRIQADFDNFRRRNQAVRTESVEDGLREAVTAMLPVLDSFDKALEAAQEETSALADGLRMIQRQYMDVLQKMGLAEIDALGEPFDPMLHHAILQEAAEDAESGTIIEVIQKGYLLKDKVIRYAMVKVAA